MRRTKAVLEPERGTGTCAAPDHEPTRLGFQGCNAFDCQSLLPSNRSVVECQSKVDLIVLLDGSGTLGQTGWAQTQDMVVHLVHNLEGDGDKVEVSLQVFSGPGTWDDYEKCTDELPEGETLNMQEQCGIQWISHYTNDMGKLETDIKALEWPRATALTSVALGQAEAELINGRQDANAVVVVITEMKPMNEGSTKSAAEKLSEKAKVIWVPVGPSPPTELIDAVASKPHSDHVVTIPSFADMSQPTFLNKVLTSACPIVG